MFRSLHLLEFWWGDRDGRSYIIIARPILMEDGSVGGDRNPTHNLSRAVCMFLNASLKAAILEHGTWAKSEFPNSSVSEYSDASFCLIGVPDSNFPRVFVLGLDLFGWPFCARVCSGKGSPFLCFVA